MEKDEVEIVFGTDGKVRSIYKDSLQPLFHELGKVKVNRASNVEWEQTQDGKEHGWTVRAAHDRELAIRCILTDGHYQRVVSKQGELLYFNSREAALETELEHFWELLPPQKREDVVMLTRAEFNALLEYSTSLPTGTTVGKRWKRNKAVTLRTTGLSRVDRDDWWMGEYVEETQEPWKSQGYVGIKWRKIEIKETP